jgi:hypothetical protein
VKCCNEAAPEVACDAGGGLYLDEDGLTALHLAMLWIGERLQEKGRSIKRLGNVLAFLQ